MDSFYGGRQGRTYDIVKHFDSIAAMTSAFSSGGGYQEVLYGLYVIIDTMADTSRNYKDRWIDPQNGIIYRRGFNYTEEVSAPSTDSENYSEEWDAYIKNPGNGAIYVGHIPSGKPASDIGAFTTASGDNDQMILTYPTTSYDTGVPTTVMSTIGKYNIIKNFTPTTNEHLITGIKTNENTLVEYGKFYSAKTYTLLCIQAGSVNLGNICYKDGNKNKVIDENTPYGTLVWVTNDGDNIPIENSAFFRLIESPSSKNKSFTISYTAKEPDTFNVTNLIDYTFLDINNNLIIVYTNGESTNVGNINGIKNIECYIDEGILPYLEVEYTNGTKENISLNNFDYVSKIDRLGDNLIVLHSNPNINLSSTISYQNKTWQNLGTVNYPYHAYGVFNSENLLKTKYPRGFSYYLNSDFTTEEQPDRKGWLGIVKTQVLNEDQVLENRYSWYTYDYTISSPSSENWKEIGGITDAMINPKNIIAVATTDNQPDDIKAGGIWFIEEE